ncbi:hypothetical protein FACS189491_01680 [Spirochaetia bacterium]|nr:hypothetical protein FACS189491_01680 [Spirochaetia bacterium]
MNDDQQMLFDERFLEKYAGNKLLHDPVTAVIELIANSWDAGATEVRIQWPEDDDLPDFSITDNGCGMSEEDFKKIWRTLSYDRTKYSGKYATANGNITKRIAFGKNGIGRFSGFCFGNVYDIISMDKENNYFDYQVSSMVKDNAFSLTKNTSLNRISHKGTKIIIKDANAHGKTSDDIRSEIAMRFFDNDNFKIFVQNTLVTFDDIPDSNITEEILTIDGNQTTIRIIDIQETDRTTRHHGIAWKINNRLVGDISWEGISNKYNVDGRRIESRRSSFIIVADFLNDYVLSDWSGFEADIPLIEHTQEAVYKYIWKKLIELSQGQREETFSRVKNELSPQIKKLSPLRREELDYFIKETQEKCPSFTEAELKTVSSILANMELSKSRYGLLTKLNELSPDQIDNLDTILRIWSVDSAKIVLDEMQTRLRLLKDLEDKLYQVKADEVHELQPLFERGLWIFGPEYESIEYTSNKGMTTVIQELFGDKTKASSNRPDFIVRTDSSVGLYSRYSYDDDGAEIGVDKLVIIELKAPGVPLKDEEIRQPIKYAKELFNKGHLKNQISKVVCFVIGQSIAQGEEGRREEKDGSIIVNPIIYDIVIRRAKTRMFKLYDKIKDSPFMKDVGGNYTKDIEDMRSSLL